jgi:N-dimethylarginine dimethylaminohydrolase
MTTLLMSRSSCACEHPGRTDCDYRVAWSINPHMRVGAADARRAHAEHTEFVGALRRESARVIRLPFVHGAFDSVFVKDSVIATAHDAGLRALPATPRHRQRSGEPQARARHLERLGFTIEPPLPTALEGGDVVVLPRRRIALLGHGIRSDAASALGLSRFLACDVMLLELRDQALFHLDTALTVLDDDTLLLCEQAFTPQALRTLARMKFRRVEVLSRKEALQFALNVVELGDAIVCGADSPSMRARWARLGRRMVVAALDQFHLGGGSAACLVSRVHELTRAAALAA